MKHSVDLPAKSETTELRPGSSEYAEWFASLVPGDKVAVWRAAGHHPRYVVLTVCRVTKNRVEVDEGVCVSRFQRTPVRYGRAASGLARVGVEINGNLAHPLPLPPNHPEVEKRNAFEARKRNLKAARNPEAKYRFDYRFNHVIRPDGSRFADSPANLLRELNGEPVESASIPEEFLPKWKKSDDGFVESKCGQFRIRPICWGRVKAIRYELIDMGEETDAEADAGRRSGPHKSLGEFDTQTEAKTQALRVFCGGTLPGEKPETPIDPDLI